ncbi:MAG: hypothetical protein Q4B50_01925 [Bacillota bacterium]|nr:hypothetical protein [Bacillota bacterium]
MDFRKSAAKRFSRFRQQLDGSKGEAAVPAREKTRQPDRSGCLALPYNDPYNAPSP